MPEAVVATPVTPAVPATPATPVTPAAVTPGATPPNGNGAAPPAEDPKTLLGADHDKAPAATPVTPADWPSDWREKMAAGNEKALNVIKRFGSPQAIANALLADRQRMSSGQLKPALTADATPEQIASYRKDNGIPEAPDGYLEKLPDGLVIGDADKPYVSKFAEAMHAKNASPDMVHSVLNTYFNEIMPAQQVALQDMNEEHRLAGEEALMAEWGAEFKGNKNAVLNLLNGMPEDARNALTTARDKDGVFLFNRPEVVRALSQVARDLNPAATLVPNDGGDATKAVESEVARIRNILVNKPDEYWARNEEGQKLRARFGELLAAQERMGGKRSA